MSARRKKILSTSLEPHQEFKMCIKREEIADAISRGGDMVRGNLEILKYLELIESLDPNGGALTLMELHREFGGSVTLREMMNTTNLGRDIVRRELEVLKCLGLIESRTPSLLTHTQILLGLNWLH